MMPDLQRLLNKAFQIVHALLSRSTNHKSSSIQRIYNTTPSFACRNPTNVSIPTEDLVQRFIINQTQIHKASQSSQFWGSRILFRSLPIGQIFFGGHPNVPGVPEHLLLPGLKASEYLGVFFFSEGFTNLDFHMSFGTCGFHIGEVFLDLLRSQDVTKELLNIDEGVGVSTADLGGRGEDEGNLKWIQMVQCFMCFLEWMGRSLRYFSG